MHRSLVWLIPLVLLLASFGRLVARPSSILADATRPTIDRARVVDASPGNDLTRQFWPTHLAIARTLSHTGRLPQWDDRGFGGRPLVGNPQAGLFYPPVWLAWLIPAPATLGWITVGHLIWASLGMIRLTRTLGLRAAGQMIAAGCFVLSPYVLAQTSEGHYPHVWAVSWYPWAFDAVTRLGRGDWPAGLVVVVCLAAVILAGHPQEGYYLVLALGIWASVDLTRLMLGRGRRTRVAPTFAVWAGLAALTLGLVAVELIPAALAQTWTLRSARLPLSLASRYHPLLINAWQLINPLALGGPSAYFGPDNYWETVLSVGLVPLILALVGTGWTRERERVRGWALLVVVAVVFAAGRKLGLFAICYDWVPGIDRFRVPARSLFLANLGAAVLAGFGVEALGRDDQPARWVRLGRCWSMGLVVLLTALGWGSTRVAERGLTPGSFGASVKVEESRSRVRSRTDGDRSALALNRIARQGPFWLAVGGVSLGLVWGVARPKSRRRVAVALGLVGLVELAGSGFTVLVTSSPDAWLTVRPIERALLQACADQEIVTGSPSRVRADEEVLSDLMATHLGLTKTDINDTFQIQHAADLYQRLYELSRPRRPRLDQPMDGPVTHRLRHAQQAVLDQLAVAVVAASDRTPRLETLIAQHRWPIAVAVARRPDGDGRFVVARNQTSLPRAYLVPRSRVVADEDLTLSHSITDANPREMVVMTRDPLAGLTAMVARQPFCPVEWHPGDPDRLVLKVATTGPALLVITDTWMPGWTATVNGQSARVERGNHAQRVVGLPVAGDHEVILHYEAPGFRLGRAISLISLGVWVVASLVVGFGRMRSWRIT